MSSQPIPAAPGVGTRRGKSFRPLTSHGMPKAPGPASPGGSIRPHRFSTIGSPAPFSPTSPPMTPMSPGLPMSPMSAKSFGTFIDSAPSTPAYSPRMGNGWDSSTLVLLSPVSTAPSSPPEPQWEMMTPGKKGAVRMKEAPSLARNISSETSLSSHPIKPIQEESQKENQPPVAGETSEEQDEEKMAQEEQRHHTAPLGRLATRMKSILRRKTSVSEKSRKKTERRQRQYEELDRMEDVHWTEM